MLLREIINCQAPAAMNKLKLFILLVLAVFVLLSLTEEASAVFFLLSRGRIRAVEWKHEKRKRYRSKSRTGGNTRRQKKYHEKIKELERWNQRFALKIVS